MPHAVYLHSGLTQNRIAPQSPAEARQIVSMENLDGLLAMGLAGLINMAMLTMAAAAFYSKGHTDVVDIAAAYRTLTPLLGGAASLVFLCSLLASGLSSSAVGTMAGQVIMQGFVGFRIPVWGRRIVTMVPALVVVVAGVNPVETLILSQVVLSLVLPLPLITLLRFSTRRDLMGPLASGSVLTLLGVIASAVILSLNAMLLWNTLKLSLPFGL